MNKNIEEKCKEIEQNGVQEKYLALAKEQTDRLKSELSGSTHLTNEVYGAILEIFGNDMEKYTFLDLGCGSKTFTTKYSPLLSCALVEKGAKVIGVDLQAPDEYDSLVKKGNFEFLQMDLSMPWYLTKIKEAAEEADIVVANSFLEGGLIYSSGGMATVSSYLGSNQEWETYTKLLEEIRRFHIMGPKEDKDLIFIAELSSPQLGDLKGEDLQRKIEMMRFWCGGSKLLCGANNDSKLLGGNKIIYK